MRLSWHDIRAIKNKILEDMYGAAEEDFEERKTAIAKQNREYYLAPMQHLLDQLPIEILSRDCAFGVTIKYAPNPNDPGTCVSGVWKYFTDTFCINPHYVDSYGNLRTLHIELNPRLYAITAKLCNEILVIEAERKELLNYLNITTEKYSGSVQLKQIWPATLHKYLPPEPPKVKKKKKTTTKLVTADPSIPEFIPIRLTTNLLEGN